VFIEGTVVNVALPALQRELGASVADVQWVVVSYTLLLASLMLLGGSLGDHYGRRRVFGIGVLLFALASVWCGLAPNIEQLIVARLVQGIGGALLVPGSLALISASFTEEQRGRAIGTWSGFSAIAAGVGPLIGGWLIETVSWRWAFLMTAPLAAVVILILFWKVPESRNETAPRTLDWPGSILAALGLGGVVYALIESSNRGIGDGRVLAVLVLGIVLLGLFIIVEARSQAPMMPLGLFRARTFSGANLLTLLLYGAMIGATFYLPFNLIQVQGYSATAAGAAFLPFVVLIFLLSRWSGGLVSAVGAKLPLIVGPVVAAAGLALLAVPGVGGSYWTTFFPGITVLGLGMAISIAPLTATVMGAVDERYAGIASGINNTASRAAGAIAVAALSIVMLAAFNASLDERLDELALSPATLEQLDEQRANMAAAEVPDDLAPETRTAVEDAIDASFVTAFRTIALVAAVLALVSALVSALMIEGKRVESGEVGVERRPAPAPARSQRTYGRRSSVPTRDRQGQASSGRHYN
jgi:EmrB/QacA subfamily drug resistance transporter